MKPKAPLDLNSYVYRTIRAKPGIDYDELAASVPPFLLVEERSPEFSIALSLEDLITARLIIAITKDGKALIFDDIIQQHDTAEIVLSLLNLGLVNVEAEGEALSLIEAERELLPYTGLRFFSSLTSTFIHSVFDVGTQSLSSVFGRPDRDRKWPDVFVMMPFAEEFTDLYSDHILPVCGRLGLSVGRGDDFFHTTAIMMDIWSAIHSAKIVISDCTSKNPNVFYETGIAHTLGKDTILLTQTMDDIPFDLRHLRIIVYNFTPRGAKDLENKLEATMRLVGQR